MLDTPVFFIEPVARGYRLDVLASAVSAIRASSQRPIFVVTREDFASRELARRIEPSWTDVQFVAAAFDLGGARTGMLGVAATEALLDATMDMMPRDGKADIVFLGADDYLGALATRLPGHERCLGRANLFVFLYNSDDLIAGQLSRTATARAGRDAIAALETMDATLVCFGEGLHGQRIGRRAVKVLPDPWHGHFAYPQRKLAREAWGLPPEGLLVTAEIDLLLAMSDSAWAAVPSKLAKLPIVYFALPGNVWALRDSRFKPFLSTLGKRLIYAGPALDAERDIKLVAATDWLLGSTMSLRCSNPDRCIAEKTRTSAVRRVRAAALGAGFERDIQRMLLDSVDDLLDVSGLSMSLMRDELDRLAHERLLRAFGARLRAALRRSH